MDKGTSVRDGAHYQHTVVGRKTSVNGRGDPEGVRPGYNKGGIDRLCKGFVECVFGSEAEWRMEKDFRLHASECVLQGRKVQDGGPQVVGTGVKEGNVVCKSGHKDSVSPRTCGRGSGPLPMFHVQQPCLSVFGNAIRNQDGSAGVFPHYAQVCGSDKRPLEGRSGPIYRRHLDGSYGSRVFDQSNSGDNSIFEKTGLVNQPGEVRASPEEGVYVSRLELELRGDECLLRQGEGAIIEKASQSVDKVCREGKSSDGEVFSFPRRQVVGDKTPVSSGEPVSGGIELCEVQGCEERVMVGTCQIRSLDSQRPPLVVTQVETESSGDSGGSSAPRRDVDGRLTLGVGGTCDLDVQSRCEETSVCSRFLGERVVVEQERIVSCGGGFKIFLTDEDDERDKKLGVAFGQHHDGVQFEQVCLSQDIDPTDERAMCLDVDSGSDDESAAHPGSEQLGGGQFVTNEPCGRLCSEQKGTQQGVADVKCTDRLRFVCDISEPTASSLLLPLSEGQAQSGSGCIEHIVEKVRYTIDTSPSSVASKMFVQGPTGGGARGGDSSTMVGTTMVRHIEIDDFEDEDSGGVVECVSPRESDAKGVRQVTSGKDSNLFSGRRNDEGQQMVLELLEAKGLLDVADWFFGSVAPSTMRNYRRGYTLFSKLTKSANLSLDVIKDVKSALALLIRVLKVGFERGLKVSAVMTMKTAIVKLFEFIFNKDLSEAPLLKMAMRFYTLGNLPKKEMLRLQWSVDQLFKYLCVLPAFSQMAFSQLTQVAIVLCVAFTTLRFTELMSLDLLETNPERDYSFWKFWVHVKGHDYKEPVYLHGTDVEHLDPVRALVELRKRILARVNAGVELRTFWFKEYGGEISPMSYNDVRVAAVGVLQAAGISDRRPYHIKHAVLTCLDEAGASAKEIASFARHSFDSMSAYKHYVSYDGGKQSVSRLMESVK
jgi:integrase